MRSPDPIEDPVISDGLFKWLGVILIIVSGACLVGVVYVISYIVRRFW
jgi:hypothetical protein